MLGIAAVNNLGPTDMDAVRGDVLARPEARPLLGPE